VERYLKLFAGQKAFVSGAQLVVEAMLQSPNFLFRVERGGAAKPYEIASRLSYFLWDTMPDSALFAGRESGRAPPPPLGLLQPEWRRSHVGCWPIRGRSNPSMSS